ncbi:MSC_0882 family membrane protein [Mycoplasma hafezii]|uniref:MSC_0882 family membrane protein n=1 Tax=Mycoplasma hafezii TaxID=525886 RepID=UPI003CEE251D
MNNFSPRSNDNDVNVKTSHTIYGINEKQPAKVYNDPHKQINPSAFTTIKKEKNIKLISGIIWMVFFLVALIALGIVIGVTTKADSTSNGVGYYILIGIAMVITLPMGILNFIKLAAWKKTEQSYRHNYTTGDAAASTMFADVYKSVTLKSLRLTWIFGFFLTYFGLFLLVILALYNINGGQWEIGSASESVTGNFHIEIKWQPILDKAFAGDTNRFLVIGLIGIIVVSALYAFVMLYDKKRLYDLKSYLGADAATIINGVADAKRSENKAWLRMYIIVFILVVLLPLAVFIYLAYTRIIRRKK